jgi:hypothetical protein
MTNDHAVLAARNNALWCDAICRVNGRPGEFRDGIWIHRHGTPRFYPDAVSLTRAPGLEAIVAALIEAEPGRGWAVKDSFDGMNLSALDFESLFEAQWLFRKPPEDGHVPDELVIIAGEADLAAWEKAWAGPEAASGAGPFKPALLGNPDVVFICIRRGGAIVGGGILNRGGGAVGLSNLFAPACPIDEVWQGMAALAARIFPGLPLVGYERGPELAAARRNGFEPVGDLRIWHRPGDV